MPHQDVRVLLGWMDRDEAVATQLGSRLPTPEEDTSSQIERWNAARESVAARPQYNLALPILEPLPPELRGRGEAFLQRPDITTAFAGWEISVGMVTLAQVLSFQKVVTEGAVARAEASNPGNLHDLFSLCLPDAASPLVMPAAIDPDGRGFSLASSNPNLRVLGPQLAQINGNPFLGFNLGFGSTFVQVVEYQDRWFVRDGYHRCYGLPRLGVGRIPALFIRAQNVGQFGWNATSFFRWDVIYGPRPPFLTDFLDDGVAENTQRPVAGKVIRITAQEFGIQL